MAAGELAAKRYAEAAFDLALRDGDLDAWSGALSQIGSFMSEADIRRVLENTRVPQETKQRLIEAGLGNLPKLLLNLARLLVRKNRTALAAEIAAQFARLVEEQRGVAHARAVTAVPLSDQEKQALAQRLERDTGQRAILATEVDPTLIGGVVVQIGDRLVDASTRHRLEALRESLAGAVG
jgi:F-type H+-transporting ATPase subunit delta